MMCREEREEKDKYRKLIKKIENKAKVLKQKPHLLASNSDVNIETKQPLTETVSVHVYATYSSDITMHVQKF